MSKYARRDKKRGVARIATPDQQSKTFPPPKGLSDAKSIIEVFRLRRYDKEVSWRVVAWELGINDRGTLSRVASGSRKPTAKLLAKVNSVYGCHLHLETVKRNVPVCPVCDQPYEPRHRCPSAPRKPRRTYDISYKQLRELLQMPYGIVDMILLFRLQMQYKQ